ncbi:GNAT family N-acetyltransferase [Gemmobacter serpentinus]|uniref:GNAT family N-acetyltransferase n=1 Tax=Gemmobacter serpentinus TaxID=2652247 RepID=UPI00124DCB7A|nr:GNAT family N-acetyltransferase [Gemmobacter serpentinus]
MTAVIYRAAQSADAAVVMAGLRGLADAMGDPFHLDPGQLDLALAKGAARAMLACSGQHVQGMALWSPFLSTLRGATGAFVTDLWVDQGARSGGIGRGLLASVRDQAAAEFGPVFLRLGVYANNPRAHAFYARLGFSENPQDHWLTLEGAALEAL